ncbi:MAG: methylmalonyl-CoA mutase [Deltaproteobacteria bacterium]|nr:methylmalonyl-CoA mutase [Deltaproteobacteria bacterium]
MGPSKGLKPGQGFEVKEFYKPQDVAEINYLRDMGDPGQPPFLRGIHPTMYRGKLWTRRQQMQWGLPQEINRQFKYLIEQGGTGLSFYRDLPTILGLDPDHPRSLGEVGRVGMSTFSFDAMDIATEGIPLDKVSFNILNASITSIVLLAQYLTVAEKRGIKPSQLRGTLTHDSTLGYFIYAKETNPLDLGIKIDTDIVEYCSKEMPLWNTMYVGIFYNLREAGALTAPQEVAFGFATAKEYIRAALERGLDIDRFAPRSSVYCQAGIDFLEEAAKMRAMRRMWARMMMDEFKAKNPRSWQLKIGVQTAGSQLYAQQPLNNIIRISYQFLSAVLGGAQSITCCTFVEPICLPTDEASKSALRCQQILAYETSLPLVADPLGGSYYIEDLTNAIEDEAKKIMDEIEGMGGWLEAIKRGWVESKLEEGAYHNQEEIEKKERLLVGVNIFQSPPEEDILPGGLQRLPSSTEPEAIAHLKHFKKNRDKEKLKGALNRLYDKVKARRDNLVPPTIEAVKSRATLEEIMGTIRKAWGYEADPYNARDASSIL